MRISRSEIKKTLRELKARSEEQKGHQPEMTLNCFLGLRRRGRALRDNSLCQKCGNYEITCRSYLLVYEIKEKLFRR